MLLGEKKIGGNLLVNIKFGLVSFYSMVVYKRRDDGIMSHLGKILIEAALDRTGGKYYKAIIVSGRDLGIS